MRRHDVDETDITTADVRWDLHFRVKLGATAGRFMAGLRDRKILSTRCGGCGWVYVPPQSYCERCFIRVEEWTELPPTGVIESFTVVRIAPSGGPKPPFVLAAIRLDGADGLLMHVLGGVDIADDDTVVGVWSGTAVEAVWAEERTGAILDIEHFTPTRVADRG
jgi:uncharacterized OB-fold protein